MNVLLAKSRTENSGTTLGGNLVALSIISLPDLASEAIVEISNCQALDAVFPDSPVARMNDVYINRVDARNSNLSGVLFSSCEVGEAIVSGDTRFGQTMPFIRSLVIEQRNGVERRVHIEADIRQEIEKLQILENAVRGPQLSDTLDVLVRLMIRGHWVRLTRDDKRGRRVLDRDDWINVRVVLEDSDLLEVKNLGAGGKPSEFIHLKKIEEFLAPEDASKRVRDAILKTGGTL